MFAFLRRIATLEAAISLPVRPFPDRAVTIARQQPAAAPQEDPVPIPARPSLLLPEED
jgi:hypothetical protein